MDALVGVLADPAGCGVYHLAQDAREVEKAAAAAGLVAWRIDIGHAHDKKDFLHKLAATMKFPAGSAPGWNALTDLSWQPAAGWVLVLEKSKHFCGGHGHEFKEAMEVMSDAAGYWRVQGKPFWTLIGGPDGWKSGWPDLPSA